MGRAMPGDRSASVDEPEVVVSKRETSTWRQTFLGTELLDCQTAGLLAADAIAPERMELGVSGSRHRVDS